MFQIDHSMVVPGLVSGAGSTNKVGTGRMLQISESTFHAHVDGIGTARSQEPILYTLLQSAFNSNARGYLGNGMIVS